MKALCLIVVLICASICTRGQSAAQSRKDSLNSVGVLSGPNKKEHLYIVDSVLIVGEVHLGKIPRLETVQGVSRPSDPKAVYCIKTGRTIILNGKETTRQEPMFSLAECKVADVRGISSRKLKARFKIYNPDGALLVRCYVRQ